MGSVRVARRAGKKHAAVEAKVITAQAAAEQRVTRTYLIQEVAEQAISSAFQKPGEAHLLFRF